MYFFIINLYTIVWWRRSWWGVQCQIVHNHIFRTDPKRTYNTAMM